MKKIVHYSIMVMLRLTMSVIVIVLFVLHPTLWILSWLFRGKGYSLVGFLDQYIKNKIKDAENR